MGSTFSSSVTLRRLTPPEIDRRINFFLQLGGCLLLLRFQPLEFFQLLELMVVRTVELIDLVVGQSPTARGGYPGLRQHLRIVDSDLNHEVVHGRTGIALDDMQFVAVKPPVGHNKRSFIERYAIDYK